MENHTHIACPDPPRYFIKWHSPHKRYGFFKTAFTHHRLKRWSCMAVADKQKLGGWAFTADYRHGIDKGIEPMPWEKPPDKSDVLSITVKSKSVTSFFLLARHTDGWIDTISNHMATVSCDTPLSLHPESNFPTHTDKRLCLPPRYP
jgi:hypothetical protein